MTNHASHLIQTANKMQFWEWKIRTEFYIFVSLKVQLCNQHKDLQKLEKTAILQVVYWCINMLYLMTVINFRKITMLRCYCMQMRYETGKKICVYDRVCATCPPLTLTFLSFRLVYICLQKLVYFSFMYDTLRVSRVPLLHALANAPTLSDYFAVASSHSMWHEASHEISSNPPQIIL